MREIFKYGSVGRALRKRCLYPEPDRKNYADLRKGMYRLESMEAGRLAQNVRLLGNIMQRQINEEELKEFYHDIGAAVWYIQYLEDVLVTFVVSKRHKRNPTTENIAYERLERERKGTLDSIYGRAKDEGIIPENMKVRFETFLNERNWLIHKSRTESSTHLYNDFLRNKMLDRIKFICDESIELKRFLFEDFQSFLISEGSDLDKAYKLADANLRKLKGT